MNRFWGLKLAVMQTKPDAQAQVQAPVAPSTATKPPVMNTQTMQDAPAAKDIPPPNPVRQYQAKLAYSRDYYRGFMLKSADILTNEGRETLGGVAGGGAGMIGGTALLEAIGKLYAPFKQHGGYGATLVKLLSGSDVGIRGKPAGLPLRLALATLMGLPYGLSMTGGQAMGSRFASRFDVPESNKSK